MRADDTGCAAGHWNTGASTETLAHRSCGKASPSSWSNRARMQPGLSFDPSLSASTSAATTARKWQIS